MKNTQADTRLRQTVESLSRQLHHPVTLPLSPIHTGMAPPVIRNHSSPSLPHSSLPTTGTSSGTGTSLRAEIMTIANTCLDHMPNRSIAILSKRSGVNVQTIRHMATRGKIVNLATIVSLAAAINATIHISLEASSGKA